MIDRPRFACLSALTDGTPTVLIFKHLIILLLRDTKAAKSTGVVVVSTILTHTFSTPRLKPIVHLSVGAEVLKGLRLTTSSTLLHRG